VLTVVGLDLSLTSTGYSCDNDQRIISTRAKGPERLHDISQDLAARLVELDNPVVIIEGYSFASRNSQAHAIGELGGVVRLTLWNLRIPYVEVPPTCRAKFATGKGNAGKGEVMSAVSARTGIVWSGSGADDLCDAWLLEEMGRVQLGTARFTWPSTHLAALDKVDWAPLTPTTENT
jgi:Holliday junction resolvasome RuvABC endonuclease subunit